MAKQPRKYDHVAKGWATVGGKRHYFSSRMELFFAHYFQWLKQTGNLREWDYEPKVFYFPVKRGVTNYKPDFRIIENDGREKWVEVKGYMDAKSKTKVARFRKYYENLPLVIYMKKDYIGIKKTVSAFLPLIKFEHE